MFPRKGFLEMLKYDSEKMHLMVSGSGAEIIADVAALTMRVFYNMCKKDKEATQEAVARYVMTLMAVTADDHGWEVLMNEDKSSTTIDLSHIMNGMKRHEEGEQ